MRNQLSRILTSPVFSRAKRSSHLLRYLVEATLAGAQHAIKEYTIGRWLYLGGVGQVEPGEVWMFGFSYPADTLNRAPMTGVELTNVTIWSPSQLNVWSKTATGAITVAPPRN